ncbi:MAG: class I adenylate-forming enzyme family protein [Porticoccaceae bacterium]|nr:class I adenylate-forming enzyme family protein [Porticoccaceae bacterium]
MITSSAQRIADYRERGWWGDLTLHGMLRQHAHKHPDLLAVADQPNRQDLTGDAPQRLSFLDLNNASDNLASQLLQAGIKSGDAILVQLPNIAELVVAYLAASKIGVIISPAAVQYGAHELQHICTTINPTAMLTIEQFNGLPLAANAQQHLPETVQVLVFGSDISVNSMGDSGVQKQLAEYEAKYPVGADDILTICWTSGTTGTPKGVPRSHNMWFATSRCCVEAADYKLGDRFLNIFPMVNMGSVGAFLYPSMLVGCSIILHHPLDPGLFLTQLQDEKITFTVAPPAVLNQLAKNEAMWNQFDFSELRSIGSGSAPLAPWMIEAFCQKYGLEVLNFYGSNEGISLFCTPQHGSDATERATMFPRVGAGIEAWDSEVNAIVYSKVVDVDTGEEITEAGKIGELLFDGATVFDGYLGTDNAEVFTHDGFFRTGDLVELCGGSSAEGNQTAPNFYRIAGRCKDIINRGGMKISPMEIDILLEGLPNSAEVAVCAYTDERLGEKICACLVVSADAEAPTLKHITEHLSRQGIAKFKLPERLELFCALPRNPLGKVQRFLLQDMVGQRIKEME